MSQGTTTSPDLERLSVELVAATGRLVRSISRHAPGDLPTATLRLLSQVDELGPVTVGALAAADRCSQPTMSAGVKDLLAKGWVDKTPHPTDARSSLVTLTEEGRRVLLAARRQRAADVSRRLRADPTLDERDLATTVAVLRSLLDHESHPPTSGEATA